MRCRVALRVFELRVADILDDHLLLTVVHDSEVALASRHERHTERDERRRDESRCSGGRAAAVAMMDDAVKEWVETSSAIRKRRQQKESMSTSLVVGGCLWLLCCCWAALVHGRSGVQRCAANVWCWTAAAYQQHSVSSQPASEQSEHCGALKRCTGPSQQPTLRQQREQLKACQAISALRLPCCGQPTRRVCMEGGTGPPPARRTAPYNVPGNDVDRCNLYHPLARLQPATSSSPSSWRTTTTTLLSHHSLRTSTVLCLSPSSH